VSNMSLNPCYIRRSETET